MEFTEEIKQFAKRVVKMSNSVNNEESTKMSMIVPFFQILGYDVFNPAEFCPEYTTDVGIKKGEKLTMPFLSMKPLKYLLNVNGVGKNLQNMIHNCLDILELLQQNLLF